MALFASAYGRACRGYGLEYMSSGSGVGRSDFVSGITEFGGTDSPLGDEPGQAQLATARCGGHEAWNLPMVFGAIAIIYNLAGIGALVLDAPTTAKIFSGAITMWNAPEIAALNPAEDLPAEPIVVISRGDASGTTDNFQRYLAAAAGPAWGRGAGETFNGVARKSVTGNEGAWSAMRAAPGSITYTAWPFAKKNGLATALIVTTAGPRPVMLSFDSVVTSLAAARITGRGNNLLLDASAAYQPTQQGAYPIVIISYQVVCSTYPDPQTSRAIKSFFTRAIGEGQVGLADIGYVPVPVGIKDRLAAAIAALS